MKNDAFDTEEQLVKAIAAAIRRTGRRIYKVEFEVDAGVGIADIVLAKRNVNSTKALRALASISPRVAVLLDGGIGASIHTVDELADCVGVSQPSARKLLGQLFAFELARPTAEGFSLVSVSSPPYERIIAVEAKLSSWQRALVQAYRNLQFADESWVVLDHKYARAAVAQIDRFKASGVGLSSVSRSSGLFIHCAAQSAGPVSVGKRWQAQAVLAARTAKT